ncbi:hypothetical protein [Aquisphaera insulae]|uniref:hypothetical protein n=1 Tax=Aquisphaera insulae TaxID=2712864 RepID=UPI0013ED84DA|nr:hypothetical protein [Aquisphaera insulae]
MALALVLCAWTSHARAGCSHYVVANADPGPISLRADLFDLAGVVDLPSQVPARPKPCSGAFCSGKPAVPVPMSAPIVPSRPGDAVVPRRPALPAANGPGQLLASAEEIVRGVREGPSIERPPR